MGTVRFGSLIVTGALLLVACKGKDGGDGDAADGGDGTETTGDTGEPTGGTTTPPGLFEVRINEVVAANATGLQDEGGAYPDWIELYNPGAEDVDLGGAALSDVDGWFDQWMFPPGTILPAGGYLVVYADEDVSEGPLHTNFKISSTGEEINLYGPEAGGHVWIDRADVPTLPVDNAWARETDGSSTWFLDPTPTPGAPNG